MAVPDNGPVIVGVTWMLTILAGGFLGTRVYAKISRKQGLWWDDHILIVSFVLLLAECIITHAGQVLGFGKHIADIDPANLVTIALGSSIAASISCFASTFSKISFGVTLLRLTTGYVRAFVWFCIGTLFLIMLPSAMSMWFACQPVAKAWNSSIPGTCMDAGRAVYYGIFNAAWCAAADFALALLPWYLIWGLSLRLSEKIGVGIAMSMGILSGVCAIVKGIYVIQLRSQDFSFNGKELTIWTAVETATAIIAASIPVLRVFFKETISSYHHRSHSPDNTNGSIPLSQRNASQHSASAHASTGKTKDSRWTIMEDGEDGSSQRGILDEEMGRGMGMGTWGSPDRGDGMGIGIAQTSTVTVTIEGDSDGRGRGVGGLAPPRRERSFFHE
ncbi:integral membrane [Pyrenophora seminiperda CCB06]|uniref:Integral membrane n=1 Tax=Pyrenophora seminiperda CCB06 TaxID=1302712 RepID=A0A3M7M938_9PLEO|nr:integral membrane [Pyrenophora seminiperda CCB06]